MEKVMVIAGGIGQVALIRKLKKEGYYVINTNLYPDSPGFKYADKSYVLDVRDKEGNLKVAKEEQINAIISDQSDIAMPTVSYIASQLSLIGISKEIIDIFTDKYIMREFCKKEGFAIPDYRLCRRYEEAIELLREYGEIIIKPIDSQASRGVYKVTSVQELKDTFDLSMQQSWKDKVVLAERYIGGTEFTVDSIVANGKCTTLAISIKYQYEHNPNVTRRLYFTNESKEYDLEELKKINESIIETMKLPFGLTHAEYKLFEGTYYLIEVAARGGGTKISSEIVPLMSGIDNYRWLINMVLGKEFPNTFEGATCLYKRKAVLEFFDLPEGRVKDIMGIERISAIKNIIDFHLNFSVGDYIVRPYNDTTRPGYYIAYAESEEELNQISIQIKESLEVIYE